MTLSTAEQESLRFHLGYGNLASTSLPYTGDMFWTQVSIVSSDLSTGTETTATTAITAGSTTTVTPVAMTGITTNTQLVIDVADQAEVVVVQAYTVSNFVAKFAKAHSASGYPIATMSGLARLRLMLWDADAAWRAMTDSSVGANAGLQSVDKGDVVWFSGFRVLRDKLAHWKSIVGALSSLTRIGSNWDDDGGVVRLRL